MPYCILSEDCVTFLLTTCQNSRFTLLAWFFKECLPCKLINPRRAATDSVQHVIPRAQQCLTHRRPLASWINKWASKWVFVFYSLRQAFSMRWEPLLLAAYEPTDREGYLSLILILKIKGTMLIGPAAITCSLGWERHPDWQPLSNLFNEWWGEQFPKRREGSS